MGEKVGCLVCSALDLPCRAEQKKENDSFGWRRQMCLLIVQPVFFLLRSALARLLSTSIACCSQPRHHHLSLLWGMAQGNIYDALCTKWVQPFKSPKQLNNSSSIEYLHLWSFQRESKIFRSRRFISFLCTYLFSNEAISFLSFFLYE